MPHRTRTADENLRFVLDHWQHLRDLLDTTTPDIWPPAMGVRDYLHALDEHDAADVARDRAVGSLAFVQDEGGPGERGLALAEAPAPLRLHVVDACRAVEIALCTLADEIAADVQRPVISGPQPDWTPADRRRRLVLVAQDATDPRRWHYNLGHRTAPVAARWLRDRLAGADGPSAPISDAHRRRITGIAREAAGRIERTIGAERRSTPVQDRPCPWCGGQLTMHRGGDEAATVTCANGFDCGAPVQVIEGRRTWAAPHELAQLQGALDAEQRRRRRRDAKRDERARARTSVA
ncbi:hypothetical protein AB0K09_00555 [Streptomyces sp. NPDC049577]|uniref:hypothetical protein n=1 Tax=Streptomyces sp. NPDC049577 TaxID=3155153 RepID=UPI00342C809C